MNEKSLENRIKDNYSDFTKTQKLIANYIISNQQQIVGLSVKELADVLNVSDASIIRFARSLGYDGYLGLKNAAKDMLLHQYEMSPRFEMLLAHRDTEETSLPLYEKIGLTDVSCLNRFYETIDRSKIEEAVKQLNRAKRIHVLAFGADTIVAIFFNHYLKLMGYESMCYTDGGLLTARNFSNVRREDVVIMFATPPALAIEKPVIDVANNAGAFSIYVAPDENLEIGSKCSMTINLSSESLAFMNSYVTYFCLCDMLIMGLYESNQEEISLRMKRSDANLNMFNLKL